MIPWFTNRIAEKREKDFGCLFVGKVNRGHGRLSYTRVILNATQNYILKFILNDLLLIVIRFS